MTRYPKFIKGQSVKDRFGIYYEIESVNTSDYTNYYYNLVNKFSRAHVHNVSEKFNNNNH